MIKTGPLKHIDPSHAKGRLRKGASFRAVAKMALTLQDEILDPDAIAANAVLAVIGFADAITIAFDGVVNQQDHNMIAAVLRGVLGNKLPNEQEKHLTKLLAIKSEVEYSASLGKATNAEKMVDIMNKFADWAL